MGQNQGKADSASPQLPPIIDIEHSSIEPENEGGDAAANKAKQLFVVCALWQPITLLITLTLYLMCENIPVT